MMEGHGVRGRRAAQWGWQARRGAYGLGRTLLASDKPRSSSSQWPLWFGSLGLGWEE